LRSGHATAAANYRARQTIAANKEPPLRVVTNADFWEAGEKSAGPQIARDLRDLAFQLRRCKSADKLVERLSADERENVRLGIEAVVRIKAALDRLGQCNAPTS
jgi:hypothetical protein